MTYGAETVIGTVVKSAKKPDEPVRLLDPCSKGENAMASNTKQTESIRKRKDHPNKANLKEEQKRLAKNYEILRKAAKAQ